MKNYFFTFYFLAAASLMQPQIRAQVVVVDPGHGGDSNSGSIKENTLSSSNNAITPSGVKEKDLTLELSLLIKGALQNRGIKCVLTRETDDNPDFSKRADTAAQANPDFIVSVHFNASQNHDAIGTTAMVGSQKQNSNFTKDMEFATGLTQAVSAAVEKFVPISKPRKTIDDSHLHGGIGSNFFRQLSQHKLLMHVPKCFIEIEFIDRKDVDQQLIAQRQEAFPVIAAALAEFICKSSITKRPPSEH
jgi:N-acetylmuramoyl-L-alanine amidase